MNPFRHYVDKLVNQAKLLHAREREISLESVDIVGELLRRNAAGCLWLSSEDLGRRIGLTPNQFWKRTQAARLLDRFPAFREQVVSGETSITALTIIAPRITCANARIFLEGIRGKSGREVRELVGKVDFAGNSLQSRTRRDVDELIDRAMKAADCRGRTLTRDALLKEALGFWLEEWEDAPSLRKDA